MENYTMATLNGKEVVVVQNAINQLWYVQNKDEKAKSVNGLTPGTLYLSDGFKTEKDAQTSLDNAVQLEATMPSQTSNAKGSVYTASGMVTDLSASGANNS